MTIFSGSHVRSLLCFRNNRRSSSFYREIPSKYRLLKVLYFQDFGMKNIPKNLGNFIHLKYLSIMISYDKVKVPRSIGMLQNLRGPYNIELPKEIRKLRKLRHLIGTVLSLIHLKDGIGEMTSLQTLHKVDLDMDGAAEVIKALGKLKLGLAWPYSYTDPLQSLKRLQHLLHLCLVLSKYEGLHLHFQDGWFENLKELQFSESVGLREIIIDKGSMPSLKRLNKPYQS
jgi:hypothetical protein